MKKILLFPVLLLTIFSSFGQNQKVLNDCTVTYDVSVIDAKADPGVAAAMQGATKVVYIIKFHGSAIPTADEAINIDYIPAGAS